MRIVERLKTISIADLYSLYSALRYFCPMSDCTTCPLYNGEVEEYSTGCLAIQAQMCYLERSKEEALEDL